MICLLVFPGRLRGASLPAFEPAPLAQHQRSRVLALFRRSVLDLACGGDADDSLGELIGVSTEFLARILPVLFSVPFSHYIPAHSTNGIVVVRRAFLSTYSDRI